MTLQKRIALKGGLKKRIRSFGFAFSGLYEMIRSEPNARIHLVAAIAAVSLGFFLHLSSIEWCVLVFAVVLVFAAEGFNTAIEKLTDHLFQEYNETARIAKDVSAGAVLICAIAALVAGLIIFLPKIVNLIAG